MLVSALMKLSVILVFMLVSLRSSWKTVVGYFLVNKVEAELQSRLVQVALQHCVESGLVVHSVTCDCTNTHSRTMTLLGCQYWGSQLQSLLDGQFTNGQEVHFLLDGCHLLKLARNTLASGKVLVDGLGRHIKWAHIRQLHDLQQVEGLKFANRLGIRHVEFSQHKMKVRSVNLQNLSIYSF